MSERLFLMGQAETAASFENTDSAEAYIVRIPQR
jgi:hypothetical protein